MAMSCEPDLIVLDEPTTALDVTTQIEVLSAFKDIIRQQRIAALYVSHDLAVVSQIADRVVVLYRGEVVEEGATRQILESPNHAYSSVLVGCSPARTDGHLAGGSDVARDSAHGRPIIEGDWTNCCL
jgi:peptide/nickel transport system ATP-binding protein